VRIYRYQLLSFWLAALAITATSSAFLEHNNSIWALTLVLVYLLQALVAEILGVVVNSKGISFPYHPVAQIHFLVFWRRFVSKDYFDRIDRIAYTSIAIYEAGDPVIVWFPDRESRNRFLRTAARIFPGKSIY
jgi:hypothetical protein